MFRSQTSKYRSRASTITKIIISITSIRNCIASESHYRSVVGQQHRLGTIEHATVHVIAMMTTIVVYRHISVSHPFQTISKCSYSLTNSCVLPHNSRVLPADRRKRVIFSWNWVSASAHAVTGRNLVVVSRVSSSIHKSAIWIGPPIFWFLKPLYWPTSYWDRVP